MTEVAPNPGNQRLQPLDPNRLKTIDGCHAVLCDALGVASEAYKAVLPSVDPEVFRDPDMGYAATIDRRAATIDGMNQGDYPPLSYLDDGARAGAAYRLYVHRSQILSSAEDEPIDVGKFRALSPTGAREVGEFMLPNIVEGLYTGAIDDTTLQAYSWAPSTSQRLYHEDPEGFSAAQLRPLAETANAIYDVVWQWQENPRQPLPASSQ